MYISQYFCAASFAAWRFQVVSVKIPPSKLPEFSKAYFDMFVKYDNGAGRVFIDRRDPQVLSLIHI